MLTAFEQILNGIGVHNSLQNQWRAYLVVIYIIRESEKWGKEDEEMGMKIMQKCMQCPVVKSAAGKELVKKIFEMYRERKADMLYYLIMSIIHGSIMQKALGQDDNEEKSKKIIYVNSIFSEIKEMTRYRKGNEQKILLILGLLTSLALNKEIFDVEEMRTEAPK